MAIESPLGRRRLPSHCAGLEVVRVDAAVAEVADQQRTAEAAEVRRCPHQAPGRVQRAVAGEAGDHAAVLRVDVDEPEAGAVGLIALAGLVLGVGDHDPAADRAGCRTASSCSAGWDP